MDFRLRPIYQERASDSNTLCVIFVEKIDVVSPITDNFDSVLFIITKEGDVPVFTKHYMFDDEKKAAMHIITEKQLQKWIVAGYNKKIVEWLLNGKVLFDRNEYIETVKKSLQQNSFEWKETKLGVEYSKLLRKYQECKVCYRDRNYYDAYNHMVATLHYLARMIVIQDNRYPEVMVWNQLKYDTTIYELYKNFVTSDLAIEQRIKGLFNYVEQFIETHQEQSAKHIVKIMEREDHWSIQQLHEDEDLKIYSVNLEFFIEFLVQKGYINIERVETKSNGVYHRYYSVK